MKKILACAWLLMPLIAFPLGKLSAEDQRTSIPLKRISRNRVEYAKDRLIVKFRDGVSLRSLAAAKARTKATIHREYKRIGAYCLKIHGGERIESVLERYRRDPNVLYVSLDYRVYAMAIPNDPRFDEMYGLHNVGQIGGKVDADIDAPEAWDIQKGSSDVIIAVIDTGVDYNHEDLRDNMWRNPGEIAGNGIDDDNNGYVDDIYGYDFAYNDNDPMDGDGHGTHVAGTIAAVGDNGTGVVGVNWTAKIMALKFLDDNGSGWDSDAVTAIDYAIEKGARVLNNSWGGYQYDEGLKQAIVRSYQAGQVFVAAAGNESNNNDSTPSYPGSYDVPNIISVAATDRHDQLASFSNFGIGTVDLAAPGVSILSTLRNDRYGPGTGTSMASPHVAGAAALLIAQFPNLTNVQIKERLLSSVDPLPSLEGKVNSGGRLNIAKALEEDGVAPDAVSDLSVFQTGGRNVTLRWTATGDDGSNGTASSYDVRYSTTPITNDSEFDSAAEAAGEPAPRPPGSMESFVVRGLDPLTTYYFVLKVGDNVGNQSGISNQASGATGEATTYTESLVANVAPQASVGRGWRADDSAWEYALPFDFPFYDETYSKVYVSSNGFLDFREASADYDNTEEKFKANPRIAPLWDDLRTNVPGGDIFIQQFSADSVAIRWKGRTYDHYRPVDVEAVLRRDGNIEFHYGDGNSGLTPTIGISLGDGSERLLSAHNGASDLANAQTARFIPSFGSPPPPPPPPPPAQDQLVFGEVLDRGGRPIQNAVVLLSRLDSPFTSESVTTGADGKYEFEDPDPGRYFLTATALGSPSQDALISLGVGEQLQRDFIMPIYTGSIRGIVKDRRNGTPIADVRIYIRRRSPRNPRVRMITYTNASGEYEAPSYPTGSYIIRASKSGYRGSYLRFRLNAGQDLQQVIELRARRRRR